MKLTFIFSTKKHWWAIGARFIEWADGVPFSHVCMQIETEAGSQPYIYEAIFPYSRRISKADWLAHGNVEVKSFEFDIQPWQMSLLRESLYEQIGKRYSVIELAMQGVGIAFKGLKKKINRISWKIENELICTEYAMRVIEKVYGLHGDRKPKMSLRDVYRECRLLKGVE